MAISSKYHPSPASSASLQPRLPHTLISPVMLRWNLHLQRLATVPQILSDQHHRLLPNHQGSALSVAADIIRTDRQIRTFQVPGAVYVEALVEDAVLDDGIAGAGGPLSKFRDLQGC